MPEARKFWLPPSFQPFDLIQKVTAFESLSNMGKGVLLKPRYKREDICSSLNHFVDSFVGNGDFGRILNEYIKENSGLDPNNFSLLPHETLGRGELDYSSRFYFDGFSGLLLFYGPPKDYVGVTASIAMIEDVDHSMDRENTSRRDLIINQLQGPNKGGNEKLSTTFSNFRWERMLVEILIEWARQSGLERLFFLPSAYNAWDIIKHNVNGTAKLRYDVTAKRLGFKRENQQKPYLLFSDGSVKQLFNTIFQATYA